MRRLHHMAICLEGALYLVVMGFILTAAVIRQINLLMILYGVLAGPLLLSWWGVRSTLRRLDVVRRAPAQVYAGQAFSVELELVNGKPRRGSFAVNVRDEIKRRGGSESPIGAEVHFGFVPAGRSRTASYRGILARRGVYEFQPLKVSTRFPLGLLRTMLRFEKPGRLTVYPALGRLAPAWQRLLKVDDTAAAQQRPQRGFHDGEFYGLRDWRPGDGRNRVHWRTTARRQTLTVRQFERRRHAEYALIVELWEPPQPTEADRARTEEVVGLAATLAAEACRRGGQPLMIDLVGRSTKQIRTIGSPAALHEALRLLAGLEADPHDKLPASLTALLAGLPPSRNVVVLSTRRVDLFDRRRFAELWNAPHLQHWPQRTPCLSPHDAVWHELFRAGASS